jgi:hypothetical protein
MTVIVLPDCNGDVHPRLDGGPAIGIAASVVVTVRLSLLFDSPVPAALYSDLTKIDKHRHSQITNACQPSAT